MDSVPQDSKTTCNRGVDRRHYAQSGNATEYLLWSAIQQVGHLAPGLISSNASLLAVDMVRRRVAPGVVEQTFHRLANLIQHGKGINTSEW